MKLLILGLAFAAMASAVPVPTEERRDLPDLGSAIQDIIQQIKDTLLPGNSKRGAIVDAADKIQEIIDGIQHAIHPDDAKRGAIVDAADKIQEIIDGIQHAIHPDDAKRGAIVDAADKIQEIIDGIQHRTGLCSLSLFSTLILLPSIANKGFSIVLS
ncbi:uncharacterized protein LOC101851700 [Aplysia californica]|uniref:Uncharacterized protein LOC101851700 n=1 Tax=Aplysia californica TaxID=6500 RepID=A0ABM1W112_APLCA|nr:uncharacterized protein LOC101851700 [Aplysia californica]